MRAVVALRAEQILAREEQRLKRLKSMSGLRRWRDALVQGAALQGGAHGCALGNLVVELSDQDEQARTSLSGHFATWKGLLANGFRRRDDGILSVKADADVLATGLMAALQGGYLLAQASHDVARWPLHSTWRWPTSKALPALRQPLSQAGRPLPPAVRAPPSRAASPPPIAKPAPTFGLLHRAGGQDDHRCGE